MIPLDSLLYKLINNMPTKEEWSRINRGNKNRGRAFERKVADELGWTRIPYSGGMGGEWGKGDVVDGFYNQNGFWIVECKTQPQGSAANVSIKGEWITKTFNAARDANRNPLIATRLKHKHSSWVFLPQASYVFLRNMTTKGWREPYNREESEPSPIETPDVVWTTKARGEEKGFTVQRSWMDEKEWELALIVVVDEKPAGETDEEYYWWMMSLDKFKSLIHDFDIMIYDEEEEE